MSTMSIDAIISLVVGVPSLIVAILTYWEARRVRHEQVRSENMEFEALILRQHPPSAQIAYAPVVLDSIARSARRQRLPASSSISRLSMPELPSRPPQDTEQEHQVSYTSHPS